MKWYYITIFNIFAQIHNTDNMEKERIEEKETLKNIEKLLFSIKQESASTSKNVRFFFYLVATSLTLSMMYIAYVMGA